MLIVNCLNLLVSNKLSIFVHGERPRRKYGQGHDHKDIAGAAGGFERHHPSAEPYHPEHAILVRCRHGGHEGDHRKSGIHHRQPGSSPAGAGRIFGQGREPVARLVKTGREQVRTAEAAASRTQD